jgi:hypothetical protein
MIFSKKNLGKGGGGAAAKQMSAFPLLRPSSNMAGWPNNESKAGALEHAVIQWKEPLSVTGSTTFYKGTLSCVALQVLYWEAEFTLKMTAAANSETE